MTGVLVGLLVVAASGHALAKHLTPRPLIQYATLVEIGGGLLYTPESEEECRHAADSFAFGDTILFIRQGHVLEGKFQYCLILTNGEAGHYVQAREPQTAENQ